MAASTLFENIIFSPDDMEDKSLSLSDYCLFAEKPWTKNSPSEWIEVNENGKVNKEDIPEDMVEFIFGYEFEDCIENIRSSHKNLSQNEIVDAVIFFSERHYYPEHLNLDFG